MSIEHFDIGEVVRVNMTFADPDTGAAIDPGAITLTIEKPNAADVVFTLAGSTIVKLADGSYRCNADVLDQAGDYYARCESASPKGAKEMKFKVRPSVVLE